MVSSIPKDFSKIFELNYGPLNLKIKSLSFWTLSLGWNQLVWYIMFFLECFLFQCLPVNKPHKQFTEWDKLLTWFIWQGKQAIIRYKTIKKRREWNGHSLLPRLYFLAPLTTLLCLSSPTYTAGWKGIEGTVIKGIAISALLAGNKLQDELMVSDERSLWYFSKTLAKIIRICKLRKSDKILRWCVYNTDFTPDKVDNRFEGWISNSFTSYYLFVHKGAVQRFEVLQNKKWVGRDDFYRYL